MKLLFVADGRSPIASNWIAYFVERGHEVHLASTYPCAPALRLASLTVIAVAGGDLAAPSVVGRRAWLRRLVPVGWRTQARRFLAPLTLARAAPRLRRLAAALQPDLIHAMRIPYEGMLAARALALPVSRPAPPLLVSVWGNDFTLHAPAAPWMAALTRTTLQHAAALHTDCHRDQRLARQWGFDGAKPTIVLPGGGGVQLDVFYPSPAAFPGQEDRAESGGVVINPRGVRAYIRNDVFFRAIPLVLQRQPNTRFLCPAMAGENQAERWLRTLGIAAAVELLPRQTRPQMAELFRQAQVAVSPAVHDGTPNTLLEAMACGCYPIAGDIASLREWIIPGVNGSLVAADDPAALAETILQALQNPALRASAAAHNLDLIRTKAEYGVVMAQAEHFYASLN